MIARGYFNGNDVNKTKISLFCKDRRDEKNDELTSLGSILIDVLA